MQHASTIEVGLATLHWQQSVTLNDTMSSISKANFDGCELSPQFPQDPFLLKSSLKQHGIKISSAQFHSYFTDKERFNETLHRFLDHMHFLNAIGAKRVVVCECTHNTFENSALPMLDAQPSLSAAPLKLLVDGLHKIARLAQEVGMQVVYQPRIGTMVHSEAAIATLMEKTDPALVSLLIDTGHFFVLNIDPVRILKQYAQRVNYICLKDINGAILRKVKESHDSYSHAKAAGLFTTLGQGALDFRGLFKTIKSIAYTGWIIGGGMESAASDNFMHAAKSTRKFMKLNLGI